MNYILTYHIIKPCHELFYYPLDNVRAQFPLFVLHYVSHVISIAKLHKDVVSWLSLNCLEKSNNVQTLDSLLIVNLSHYKFFLALLEMLSFNNFTSVKLRKMNWLRKRVGSFIINDLRRIWWNTMRKINYTILTLAKLSI
jgi:hypothetical protein